MVLTSKSIAITSKYVLAVSYWWLTNYEINKTHCSLQSLQRQRCQANILLSVFFFSNSLGLP